MRYPDGCYAAPQNNRRKHSRTMQNGTLLAALDLGSNSYRLEIGRLEHGQLLRTEYLKETVRQGNGLDADRNLTPDAMQRGWDCLARFGERIAGFERTHVRAVATQTLREARNRDVFLARASELLKFPIDVVSGPEEARLIYQGVSHLLPQSDERRLVVDIGGRSTEMILGQHYNANVVASFRVGSVAWSMKYFPQGQFTTQAFQIAEIAAKAVLDEALDSYQPSAWDVAYGASGTVGAIGDILTAAGEPPGLITRAGLDLLLDRLLRAQSADRVRMDGLKEDRRAVIGGGVSVLRAIFDLLSIDQMEVAQGALRQGVLYDLIARELPQTDMRMSTVQLLSRKFDIDTVQAQRVSQVAQALFAQVLPGDHERPARKLGWAAQLHEIGCQISHSDHHRHGAYILRNTDAPGFALPELEALSTLVLAHRGKLRKVEVALTDRQFVLQLVCLRLAVALCHARRDPDTDAIRLSLEGQAIQVSASAEWAVAHPQSAHLLREEAAAWQRTAWTLDAVFS